MADIPLTVVEMVLSKRARCPVCGVEVEFEPYYCPSCRAVHHRECWHYNEGCAVYGCSGINEPTPPNHSPMQIQQSPVMQKCLTKVKSGTHQVKEGARTLFYAFYHLPIQSRIYLWIITCIFGSLAFIFSKLFKVICGYTFFNLVGLSAFLLIAGQFCVATVLYRALEWFSTHDLPKEEITYRTDEELEELHARNPKNCNIAEALAYSYLKRGHPEKARELYELCLHLNPYSSSFRRRLEEMKSVQLRYEQRGGKQWHGNSKTREKQESVVT